MMKKIIYYLGLVLMSGSFFAGTANSVYADHQVGHPSLSEDATEEEIRAVESAERICAGLEGAEYSNCIDSAGQNYLDAENNDGATTAQDICNNRGIDQSSPEYGACLEEQQEIIDNPDEDTGEVGGDISACDGLTGNALNDCARAELQAQEDAARAEAEAERGAGGGDNSEVIDLNAGGSDINDTHSFDVGNILTTTGQDTDKYINAAESPVIAFILDVINFITLIIGSIAMILIILGGLLMIASEGDENRLQRGKGIVLAAIIGLVISMASYLIVTFVQSIFY